MFESVEDLVIWLNHQLGLTLSEYGAPMYALLATITLIAGYWLLKLAIRPLVPLFDDNQGDLVTPGAVQIKGVRESQLNLQLIGNPDRQTKNSFDSPSEHDHVVLQSETDRLIPQAVEDENQIIPINVDKPKGQSRKTKRRAEPVVQMNGIHPRAKAARTANALADHVSDMLTKRMEKVPGIDVVTALDKTNASSTPHPNYEVSGSLDLRLDEVKLSLSMVDNADEQIVWQKEVDCHLIELKPIQRDLAAEVTATVIFREKTKGLQIKNLIRFPQISR